MIEFNDSFSQAAVAEAMCAHPALAKLISQQLMLPGFAYAHDVEGRRIGGPLVAPNRQPVGEWQRVIVGAYVNHGSNDAPDWSSHT